MDACGLVKTIKAETDTAMIENTAKLLAKTNHALDEETLSKLVEVLAYGIPGLINPAQIDSKERFDAVFDLYLELAFSTEKESVVFKNATDLLEFLSNSNYAVKNDLSIDILQKAIRRNPFYHSLWQNIGLKYRLQHKFSQAIEALEVIPASYRWTTYFNELLALHHAHLRKNFSFPEFCTKYCPNPHYIASEFLKKNFLLSCRKLFSEMRNKKILLFRSGPLALFEETLRCLDVNCNVTTLILQQCLTGIEEYARYSRHYIGNGWFCPSENATL